MDSMELSSQFLVITFIIVKVGEGEECNDWSTRRISSCRVLEGGRG